MFGALNQTNDHKQKRRLGGGVEAACMLNK